jgi:hypothetical protein
MLGRKPTVQPDAAQIASIVSQLKGLSTTAQLSKKDYLSYLNSKAGGRIPESMIDLIYTSIDQPLDAMLTTQEFAAGYCTAVQLVQDQIEALKAKAQVSLNEAKQYKRQSLEGSLYTPSEDDDSLLKVEVMKASGLRRRDDGGVPSSFVTLICEGATHKTSTKQRTTEPIWGESVNFKVRPSASHLVLVVIDQDAPISRNIVGEVTYPLSQLRHQSKRVVNLAIFSRDTQEEAGVLMVTLSWMISKELIAEERAQQAREKFAIDRDQISSLKMKLNLLHLPFSSLGRYYDLVTLEHPQIKSSEVSFFGGLDQLSVAHTGRKLPWRSVMMISISIALCLSCLTMFVRPDFPNLMLALVLWKWYIDDQSSHKSFKYMSFVLIASLAYDLVWFYYFFTVSPMQPWMEGSYEADLERELLRASLWISMGNFCFKVILAPVSWRFALDVQAQEC